MCENVQNRDVWIDNAKGIGILFIMISHTPFGAKYYSFFSFQVPLFFVLSGYLFNEYKYSMKQFWKIKIRKMLITYFFLGCTLVIGLEIVTNLNNSNIIDYIIMDLKSVIFQCRFSTLWFFSVLIEAEIIFYMLCKLITRERTRSLVVLTIFVISIIYNVLYKKPLPWNIDLCGMALFFYWCGYLIRKYANEMLIIRKNQFIAFLSAIFIFSISYIAYWKISDNFFNMYSSEYGVLPLAMMLIFSQIAIVCIVSIWFPCKFFSYIGRNSIVFFAWHQAITYNLFMECMEQWNVTREHDFYLYCLIEVIGSIVILTIVNEIILRTPIKKLIGK